MKIIIVCENYYPSLDATSKRMRTFAEGLVSKGHDVQVLASETSLVDKPENFQLPPNVIYYSVFGNQGEQNPIRRLLNNASGVVNSYRKSKQIDNCDVVICTSPPLFLSLAAMKIAKKKNAKYVFDIRDVWPDIAYEMGSFSKGSIYGKVFSWIADRSYKNADLVTVVSPSKLSKVSEKLDSSQQNKLVLIGNGLDLNFLKNADSETCLEKYNLIADPPCVYIGKLGFAQGLDIVLDIAKQRRDKRFLLFGSGAEEELLQKIILKENLSNVFLCGRISEGEAKTVLMHALCAIVPLKSSSMKDSVPTKLYESLGCGCPTLLIARGDSVDVLQESNLGYSAPPEDFKAVLDAFDKVINVEWSPNQRKNASECIVRNHSRQASALYLEEILVSKFDDC